MKKQYESIPPALFEYIKRKVNLPDFLSEEIGCRLNWYEPNLVAATSCPMPDHKDAKPSFRINFLEESKLWVFNCFGCGAKGTILDFCRDYYGLNNRVEAVIFLCNKYGFKNTEQVVMDGLKDVKKTVNLQKKINCAHVVASRQCFSLLRKDYSKYNKWVADAYKTMNKALDDENLSIIESIGFEASGKIQET